jgi:Na+/H+ antiporter NhaD/arsenite permease-like protein
MTWLLLAVFFIGYIFIIIEHNVKIDKAASALITGVLCWVVYSFSTTDQHLVSHELLEHISEIAGIVFFLIGAMTIVELIDLYDGFQIIIDKITTNNKRKLLYIVTLLSFFLSALLDNLTTAIVMSSLVIKILDNKQDRMLMIGMIVIAANSGGAWSPIGDVTTTMLWIGNQITTLGIIKTIFLPALVSVLIPMFLISWKLKGQFEKKSAIPNRNISDTERSVIFFTGLGMLIFVPVFKTITHLPPFMGMMLAVGVLWIVSETLHKRNLANAENKSSIFSALERVDMPSILFFMGILIAVSSLQSAHILNDLATFLNEQVGNDKIIVTGIGLFSAIFDNVPLVAAIQGMYDLQQYPSGDFFWNYLAYCAGTGGSILIIGSAAGVAAMGMENISFFWYLKNISLAALLGFLGGAFVTILLA